MEELLTVVPVDSTSELKERFLWLVFSEGSGLGMTV
jgi:hypothetical protein